MDLLNSKNAGCFAATAVAALWALGLAINSLVVGFCLNYVIPFWLAYADKPNKWHFWYGLAIGILPIGPFTIFAALATFIISFFI